MMIRYILLIGFLLVASVACTSPLPQSQTTSVEEGHTEDEQDHDEDHDDDEHDHDEDHDEDEAHREHDAHEHGAAELTIAWSGNDLALDLQTPAYNVVGFEYAPKTDAEKVLLAERIAILEAGEFLQFSPEANCTIVSATVATELAEEAHADGEEAEEHDEEEETHSDIDVSYNIQCEQPNNLQSLDMSALFVQFPNFADLRAQWISDTEQSAKSLTSGDSVVSFK